MAGDVNPIYQRLNSVEDYHPFTASTFADCSLEAGDIISINRGGAQFSGPTQMNTIKWTGQQQVTVEAPGEQTRGSIARMSAEAYNSGGGGGNSYRSGYRRNTKEELIGAKIRENADNIELEAWNRQNADNTFEASLKIQADKIEAEVKNRKAGEVELSGRISVEAGKINLLVEGEGANAKVKRAAIQAAVTDENGYLSSSIKISADKIILDGQTSIASVMTVRERGVVSINGRLETSGYVSCTGINIRDAGAGGSSRSIDETILNQMIKSASLNQTTNTLTLTKFNGQVINFKKATTLSGRWSGSSQGTVADFEYQTDDPSIPSASTSIRLTASGSTVYARDPSGTARASISAGSSYSNNSVLVYDHFDDEDEMYYYRSEDLITRQSVGATKTVYYN